MQLILFHHAGGDKYAFQYLSQKLNQDFEIIYYELPGRNYRLNESLLFDIHQIVDDAYNTILPYTQNDFVFIGMSMGALISFLVAEKLHQQNKNLPKHIILSSRKSIEQYSATQLVANADDETFWNYVKSFGANIDGLLQHQELKNFYEPILRADFKALEYFNHHYQNQLSTQLPISVSSLIGKDDIHIDIEGANSWNKFFTKNFDAKAFDGGHFFLYNNDEAIEYIRNKVLSLD
ncbi:MAG TPA: thioesterase domain-containing protein [Chitinophagales bacterium]|nr:hypothetical protein [Chitinophagales bacterium]HMV02139.1 thioesterase domain-containing protein [Chitinophagales bacterium]HMW93939.1 thioesterase domain-containing protein [Chitinophagales bacterium]HMY42677.1 thioesterase domain-containing protein [Chitinophagales bacterium]HMZ68659.1 thioesterase domain-containing protein [Chitinophagales bacterium]